MKKQHLIVISTYSIAVLIIFHWIYISTFDEFIHLYKKGFSQKTIDSLPVFLKPLYKGYPNLISLICFMLFTFSAFLSIQEKRKTYFYICISSFLMIIFLFIFLI